jgi:hypothetical protein
MRSRGGRLFQRRGNEIDGIISANSVSNLRVTWTVADVSVEFDDLTDHPIVTAGIVTPAGALQVMAEVRRTGRALEFNECHMHGAETSNHFGVKHLLMTFRLLLEILDVDEIIARGAIRTTGAHPGRRPRDIRVRRQLQIGATEGL